jgi:hypothetical protein
MIKMTPVSTRLQTIDLGEFPDLTEGGNPAESKAVFERVSPLFAPPLYGDSIRTPNPSHYPSPTQLLMIYYSPRDADKPLTIRMIDTSLGNLAAAEMELYRQAKSGAHGPAWLGEGFADLIWKYPCHISIVLDADDHEFFWFDPIGYDPIVFDQMKEKPVDGTLQTFHYQPNKSFYDATLARLEDPDSKKHRPVLRFVNYHRNGAGDELKPFEVALFSMTIKLLVGPRNGKVDIHLIDPDAENQGPGGMIPPFA